MAGFYPLIQQEVVDNKKFPVICNAVQADNLAEKNDSNRDLGLSNSEKQQMKPVLHEFEQLLATKLAKQTL